MSQIIPLQPIISIGGRQIKSLSKSLLNITPNEETSTIVPGTDSVLIKHRDLVPQYIVNLSVSRGSDDDKFIASFIEARGVLTSTDFIALTAISGGGGLSFVQYDIVGGTFTQQAAISYSPSLDNAEEEARSDYVIQFAGRKRNT